MSEAPAKPAATAHAPPEASVVLVVDDSPDVLALAARVLGKEYHVRLAPDGGMALSLAADDPKPDLILLDVEMEGASGFEVCRVLKEDPATAGIPLVFLSAKTEPTDQLEGFELGAVDYLTKPINARLLLARVRIHVALANRRHELERLVQERTAQLDGTRLQIIYRLARAMEYHETTAAGNRALRISQYVKLIAQAAGAKPDLSELLAHAAPLHDVGNLAVPAEILKKRDKLTVPEWERVRRHPEIGAEIIGKHDDPLLKLARLLALSHHERWDGSGYPHGLKGEEIPWPARVMAIADTFESMTTTQFYRDALSPKRAADEIAAGSGTNYDPALVGAFKKALPAMRNVRETYSDLLGDLINLDFTERAQALRTAATKPAGIPLGGSAPAKK